MVGRLVQGQMMLSLEFGQKDMEYVTARWQLPSYADSELVVAQLGLLHKTRESRGGHTDLRSFRASAVDCTKDST